MNAEVWAQALTLGSLIAGLAWSLTAGPLRIFSRSSRDFAVFNALVLLAALSLWPGSPLDALPDAYRWVPGMALLAVAVQRLCAGVHTLMDARPAYVLSPLVWPLLVGALVATAWLDPAGDSLVLTAWGVSIWVLGVSTQQVAPSLTAQSGLAVARWVMLPLLVASLVWLWGMGESLLALSRDVSWATAAGLDGARSGLQGGPWVVVAATWCLLNASVVGMLFLKFIDKIQELSTEDEVTGALNIRSFMAMLNDERERLRRTPQVQSLLMCELDQLAGLNKQLGFAAGDAALRHITAVIGRNLRKTDRLGRTPQGELVLFLPATPAVGATLVAERVQTALKSSPLLWNGQAVGLTFSMGVSSRDSVETECETFFDLARWGVERARLEGGARVRVARLGHDQDIRITTIGELQAENPA